MKEKPEIKAEKIEIRWPFEDDLPLLYANQFAVLETENEAILVFGNIYPLALLNRNQNEAKQLIRKATIKPLAKIALSKAGLMALTNLLNQRIQDQAQPEIHEKEEEGQSNE